ncbi:MAG: ABC transporter ATP-binding protein [Clostridiaceae bacterium]|nr:ABC transporter ATP-binding protein [Clostridiaceae bacterium]
MSEEKVAMRIQNATKAFGKNIAVNHVSFDLHAGEVFGFLGPNGAGKSTLIKMIMGFLSMDEGSIEINGFDRKKEYERAMSGLGGIVENPEMYRDFSGITNLTMYARIHENVPRERIDEVIRTVGMQDRAKDKVKKYSLGMKQRIGLAQAIVHKPAVLVLDEPTNGLDPVGIKDLRDILRKLAHEQGVAVMVSSHILSEMQMMCDRVGIINKGRLLDIKLVDELKSLAVGQYKFVVSSPKTAIESLGSAFDGKISDVTEESFGICAEKTEVPGIIRTLTASGVDIFAVSRTEGTLEDAYMQITGGGITVA